jgi:MFS family permease
LASPSANLTAFAYGICLGWPSPILPLLQSPDSPFVEPLAIDEISWVASLSLIGGMVATPLFGYFLEKFGRKVTLLVSAIPQIASWIILEFSSSALHLYVARVLVGFGGTGLYLAIPMFIAEISTDE